MAFENPYEYLGYAHNLGMNQIVKDTKYPAQNISDVYDIALSVAKSETDDITFMTLAQAKKVKRLMGCGCNFDELPVKLVEEEIITSEMEPFFKDFIEACQSSFDIPKIIAALNSFEATVETSGLSTNEKALFFGASAIGRHSIAYWQNQSFNIDSPWQPLIIRNNVGNNGNPSYREKPCDHWLLSFFCKDAIGAGIGGAISLGNVGFMILGGLIGSAFF